MNRSSCAWFSILPNTGQLPFQAEAIKLLWLFRVPWDWAYTAVNTLFKPSFF